jgi:N-terminal C2 in EEIG1 and EHBP1 proteins
VLCASLQDAETVIGDELSTKATLYRDKSGDYQEKSYDIELKSSGLAKKVLARFSFDAASFCSLDSQRSTVKLHALNSKGKKDSFNTDTALTVSTLLCTVSALQFSFV